VDGGFPALFADERVTGGSVRLASFGGEWHFEIALGCGRLHVSVQSAGSGATRRRSCSCRPRRVGRSGKRERQRWRKGWTWDTARPWTSLSRSFRTRRTGPGEGSRNGHGDARKTAMVQVVVLAASARNDAPLGPPPEASIADHHVLQGSQHDYAINETTRAYWERQKLPAALVEQLTEGQLEEDVPQVGRLLLGVPARSGARAGPNPTPGRLNPPACQGAPASNVPAVLA
jgi:hypothetical protein